MALLYGSGRPDLPAKIHVAEVLVYLPLAFVLVSALGVTGAAVAWTSRCTADFVLYELAGRRALGRNAIDARERARLAWLVANVVGFVVFLVIALFLTSSSLLSGGAVVLGGLLSYAIVSWARVFSAEERKAWSGLVMGIWGRSRRVFGQTRRLNQS
jgi:O-antigen/teichoic acid export membrane protein